MAEFKEILRVERVDENGNVLQTEDIDLRRGIVGEAAPTENTPGMAGLPYYVVRDGKITAEYVCVAAEDGVYTWKKKESGTGGGTDITLGITGAVVGQTVKITEVDENGKPTKWEAVDMESGGTSDAVQFIPQELTEEQQMHARVNLGLYWKEYVNKVLANIETYSRKTDISDFSDIFNSGSVNINYEDYNGAVNYQLERQSSENSDAGGVFHNVLWFGNGNLIKNDTDLYETVSEIEETKYTDVPFVLYKNISDYTGATCRLYIDSTAVPGMALGAGVYLDIIDTENFDEVYHPVPDEYIPDSIARQDDVDTVDANIPNKATVDGNTLKMQRETTTTDDEGTETAETTDLFEVELPSGGGLGTVTSVNGVLPDENGNVKIDIPESSEGTDIALGISGAAVGQIAKITAVDEAGMPTAWEAVELPDGGGSGGVDGFHEYTYTAEVTTDGTVSSYEFSADADGNPMSLDMVLIKHNHATDAESGYQEVYINGKKVSYRHTAKSTIENMFLMRFGDCVYGIITKATDSNIGGMNVGLTAAGFSLPFLNGEKIKSIKITSFNSIFPEGDTIRIFGR